MDVEKEESTHKIDELSARFFRATRAIKQEELVGAIKAKQLFKMSCQYKDIETVKRMSKTYANQNDLISSYIEIFINKSTFKLQTKTVISKQIMWQNWRNHLVNINTFISSGGVRMNNKFLFAVTCNYKKILKVLISSSKIYVPSRSAEVLKTNL